MRPVVDGATDETLDVAAEVCRNADASMWLCGKIEGAISEGNDVVATSSAENTIYNKFQSST